MTAEGVFPKVSGDIAYASEANKFAGATSFYSGTVSISTGSSTANGCFNWTSTGSTGVVTDGNFATCWIGSWIAPISATLGSIVLTLDNDTYKSSIRFCGSFSLSNDSSWLINSVDSTGSNSNVFTTSGGFYQKSFFNPSIYKTNKIVFYPSIGQAVSGVIKLYEINAH